MGVKEYKFAGDNCHRAQLNDDGSNLLELYDFVKGEKKDVLSNNSKNFYNSEIKTLRQKAIDNYIDKAPDFVTAFAQEFVAYIFVKTIHSPFKSFLEYKLFVGKQNIYQSSFRNAFNSLKSASKKEEKITLLNCFSDFATGIDYSYLFSDNPDIIRREVIKGLGNVVKNLLDRLLNKTKHFKLNNFFKKLGYQFLYDLTENEFEKILEKIGVLYNKDYNNYKY